MIINCYKSIRDLVIVYWFLGSCSEQCVGVREWTEEWRKYRLTAKETKELNRRGTLGWSRNDEPGSFTLISIYHITCEWTINIVFMTFTITHHHPLNILWPFPFLSTFNIIKLFRKRKTHRHRTSRIVVSSSSCVALSLDGIEFENCHSTRWAINNSIKSFDGSTSSSVCKLYYMAKRNLSPPKVTPALIL